MKKNNKSRLFIMACIGVMLDVLLLVAGLFLAAGLFIMLSKVV